MNVLTFEPGASIVGGRRVRRARFEARSLFSVSAACLVANAMRETLSSAYASTASVRLLEPRIPDPRAWETICTGASLFTVRGHVADAAIVLRPQDAQALVAAAFGERAPGDGTLSGIEREVLARAVRAIATCLSPVCGAGDPLAVDPGAALGEYATYFEILLERPVEARIGVALAREPSALTHGNLRFDDIGDIEIELCASIALGDIPAARLLTLACGDHIAARSEVSEHATLNVAGAALGRGTCGVRGSQYAFIIH